MIVRQSHLVQRRCGRGAVLLMAAQRLTTGRAVGVDLGYSASSSAATALDNILGTNETRIRLSNDGLCKMRERPPDLERLKRLAHEMYENWSKSQA